MDDTRLPDADDDELKRPTVTPVPAPPDDQFVRIVAGVAALGAIVTLAIAAWLRRNVMVSWRR